MVENNKLKNKIHSELKLLSKEKGIYVFISKAEHYNQTNLDIIEHLTTKLNMVGVYITMGKNYLELSKEFKNKKVKLDNLFFIDAISRKNSSSKKDQKNLIENEKNVTFIEGPSSLVELSIAVNSLCDSGNFDFIFFDSISSLLVYNDLKTSKKFVLYMLEKIKNYDLSGIIISIEENNSKEIIPAIAPFCKSLISLK